jgi:hypothetical protein
MRVVGAIAAASLAMAAAAAASEPPAPSSPDAPPTAVAAPARVVPPGEPAAPALPATAGSPASPPAASTDAGDSEAAADLAAARAAADGSVDSPGPGRTPGGRVPADAEVTIDRRNAVVADARFGGPIGASLRLSLLHGLGAKVNERDGKVDAVCSVPIRHCAGGFLLDVEAGSGGGKLSLGIGGAAKVQDEDFRGTVGAGLKVSLARTWGNPRGTVPGMTYVGPELDLYVLRAGVSLGVLWRVAGDGGRTTLLSWGVGLRL